MNKPEKEKYILVMGAFSSGRTLMISALVGSEMLPSYSLPTTSVITELHYGEDKKAVIYPKKGKKTNLHGDSPFVVPVEKDVIEKYMELSSDSISLTPDYEKIEVYWPAEMLKSGVVIADVPATFDYFMHTDVLNGYVAKAKAVIYVISAVTPYTSGDKAVLEWLNQLGVRNIIPVCTFWDIVQREGETVQDKVREFILNRAAQHTDLGVPAIHFLSSRDGLRAQVEKDSALWNESGYAEFTDYLSKFINHQGEKNNYLKQERNLKKMDKLSQHSKIMEQFKELIAREKSCAKVIDDTQGHWCKTLDAVIDRTKEDFIVVVMGNFSAGKSTMINALIGKKVLPSYPMPTTAVMTELRYGDEKKIVLYPRKGQNIDGHGDKPFTVPATEDAIEQYITIDNDAGINVKDESSAEISSKFEKMELYWPLEMLKNGVVIVDSPGLNDPYSNDVIVKNYLPKADAIIYALNTTAPYLGTDKKELESLNQFGINNIIFACTYWDIIRSEGEKTANKTRTYCISSALNHTNLGESSIHFLASKDGLHARIENDTDLWTVSGFLEFEAYLQDYLTRRKGKDKINNIATALESQAEAMKKQAVILDENSKKDKKIIEQNIAAAKEKLNGLKKDAKAIHNTFVLKLENKKSSIEATVKKGLRSLKDKIDLEDFTPKTEFRSGIKKLNPFGKKKIAEDIAAEFQEEYKSRIEKELLKYQSTIVAEEMKLAVKSAAESIEDNIKILAKELDELDISVGLPSVATEQSGQGGNPLLGIAYGLITMDWWTGGSIALYGGAGRQIGLQLGTTAGLALAIALGVPIALPVAALALIAANIAGILMDNNEKRVNNIRQETLSQLQKAYFNDGDDNFIEPTASAIMKKVDEIFNLASSDVMDVISETFSEKEKVFEAMLAQADMESNEKEKFVAARKTAVAELDAIIEEVKALQAC